MQTDGLGALRKSVLAVGIDKGQAASALAQEIRGGNLRVPTEIITDPRAALETALAEMEEGEIVVYFYEDMAMVKEVLAAFQATPLNDLAELGFPEKPKTLLEVG